MTHTPALRWRPITDERYNDRRDALPPVYPRGALVDFLMGEPVDHRECSRTGRVAATFRPFVRRFGQAWEGTPLTVREAETLTAEDLPQGVQLHGPFDAWDPDPQPVSLDAAKADPAGLAHAYNTLLWRFDLAREEHAREADRCAELRDRLDDANAELNALCNGRRP